MKRSLMILALLAAGMALAAAAAPAAAVDEPQQPNLLRRLLGFGHALAGLGPGISVGTGYGGYGGYGGYSDPYYADPYYGRGYGYGRDPYYTGSARGRYNRRRFNNYGRKMMML